VMKHSDGAAPVSWSPPGCRIHITSEFLQDRLCIVEQSRRFRQGWENEFSGFSVLCLNRRRGQLQRPALARVIPKLCSGMSSRVQ
jgi:hypothetical protein